MLFDKNGLWLIDASSPSTASKAVWLNQSGIMLSKLRTGSDKSDPSYNSTTGKSFTWKTAITADGIVADYLVGTHLHGEFDISAGNPTTSGVYSTCPFYVSKDRKLSCTNADIKGVINATDLKLDGDSIKAKLKSIVDQINVLEDGIEIAGTDFSDGKISTEAGSIKFTGSSSADYAVELSSPAVRIKSTEGSVYLQNNDQSAWIQLLADGKIIFKAKSIEGISTATPVFG